jgi:hypothetical protein
MIIIKNVKHDFIVWIKDATRMDAIFAFAVAKQLILEAIAQSINSFCADASD